MNFLSLFAGVEGIGLGLERAGLRCVGQAAMGSHGILLEPCRVGRSSLTVGGLSGLDSRQSRRAAREWLEREPRVGRLANGIPAQVDRLRVAGNAVVPQVAEHVGRLLMEFDQERAA